jgi:epoxyqueuosine reductase QueG
MDTYDRIASLVTSSSCDFLGVADLAIAREVVRDQGGDAVAGFPKAISIGIILPHAIVDQLPNRSNRAVAVTYRSHASSIINQRLDAVASQVASVLQEAGHRALPIPAAERYDDERICAVFSHKLAAHLAGLGWIGKSCLLVTPQAGPRVRWTSVLTDAPLAATGGPTEEKCGDCTECVNICPVHAFTGRPFRAEEPRSARYDAGRCAKYFEDMEREGGVCVCGLCLYVCPHGRSRHSETDPR